MKNFRIILKNAKGEIEAHTVSKISFPEAVSHAYHLRGIRGLDFEITSVSKIK